MKWFIATITLISLATLAFLKKRSGNRIMRLQRYEYMKKVILAFLKDDTVTYGSALWEQTMRSYLYYKPDMTEFCEVMHELTCDGLIEFISEQKVSPRFLVYPQRYLFGQFRRKTPDLVTVYLG